MCARYLCFGIKIKLKFKLNPYVHQPYVRKMQTYDGNIFSLQKAPYASMERVHIKKSISF